MRSLPKRDPYLPTTSSDTLTPAKALDYLPALDPAEFAHQLLDAVPRDRLSLLGHYRARAALERNRKLARATSDVLEHATKLLDNAGKLAVAREKFYLEVTTAAQRARLARDIEIAELDLKLANLNKAKRAAARDDD